MKPSAVRLRSDRNWMRSWFPSENTGLRESTSEARDAYMVRVQVERNKNPPVTYSGGLSPQYFPILLASLISAPLKMETWS